MKRIVWLTDIHLNFVDGATVDHLLREIEAVSPDAVLIGGDIGESHDVAVYLSQIAESLQCPIYFVLGNHDYYRSSIVKVREAMTELCQASDYLCYLTQSHTITLTDSVGLLGHDGWADARSGDYENSDVFLTDYALIAELAGHYELDRRPMLSRLGDQAADYIRALLPNALKRFEHVLLLTHVPPLREACWYEGRISDDNWAPHFVCQTLGEAILDIMRDLPERKLTVLCGHTHGEGETQPLDNVHVVTAGAVYGRPAIARVFELED